MMGRYAKLLLTVAGMAYAALFFSAYTPNCAHAKDDIEKAGDIIQILLPLSALGATYLADDPEGRVQFSKAFTTGFVAVYGTKFIVQKARPNETDREDANFNSFPSGHTWAAFSGASFINRRYGYKYGIPAYLAAAFVGYSRVHAEAHFWDDVVTGASIALLCNWYYTTPYSKKVILSPIVNSIAYGLTMHFNW